jgi:hypothetical protein
MQTTLEMTGGVPQSQREGDQPARQSEADWETKRRGELGPSPPCGSQFLSPIMAMLVAYCRRGRRPPPPLASCDTMQMTEPPLSMLSPNR